MAKLYIALVDTPGVFAWMIRKTIRINYIHVVLSLDGNFQEAYSVGRRNPFIPFLQDLRKKISIKYTGHSLPHAIKYIPSNVPIGRKKSLPIN